MFVTVNGLKTIKSMVYSSCVNAL